MKIECVVESRDIVGEGPVWHPEQECIYWTDINGCKISRYATRTQELETWRFATGGQKTSTSRKN
jgi:sugar lactone lactonase YvrE